MARWLHQQWDFLCDFLWYLPDTGPSCVPTALSLCDYDAAKRLPGPPTPAVAAVGCKALGSENRESWGKSSCHAAGITARGKGASHSQHPVGAQVGLGVGKEAKLLLGVVPELHPRLESSAASRKN